MTRLIALIVTSVVLAVFMIVTGLALVSAAPQERVPQWKYEQCYTNECIANTLNKLSAFEAQQAKITTWKNTTYVWYRE